ncbi:hypothetical protein [Burkholderia guangdongensis]|uniref:hypothetical protein n=1 Tax=Burkholderia guangdongensis TaxID=1792500 RepID=UPI001FE9C9D5|nr:hypothetical protein [Burkholderia guangdongensis]
MKRFDSARTVPAAAAAALGLLLLFGGGGRLPGTAFAQTGDARVVAATPMPPPMPGDASPDPRFDAAAVQRIPLARLDASLPADARLRLFTITDRPGLYVMHAPNLFEQGAMFSRVVALLERRDMPRDHIVTMAAIAAHARRFDTDPAGLTAGNNFSATELAHFFDVAQHQHLTLTDGERRLLTVLAGWGLIHEEDGVWRARSERDFLITIPGPGPAPGGGTIDATVRAAILSHELGHWRYFSDTVYAHACRTFWWHDLSYAERAELTRQLANVGYDPSDRIVIDETQAYLLHTPAAYIPFADTPGAYGIDVASVRRRLEARVGQAGR